MDQSQPDALREKARSCRALSQTVEPQKVVERLRIFARIYEQRADLLENPDTSLIEPGHYPSKGRAGRRA